MTDERIAPDLPDASDVLVMYPDLEPFFVGMVERFGQLPIRCYALDKVLAHYMADGMTFDEAVEHFEFNVRGAWVGPTTPCFIRPPAPFEQADADLADL
jgi:hypothetical protein